MTRLIGILAILVLFSGFNQAMAIRVAAPPEKSVQADSPGQTSQSPRDDKMGDQQNGRHKTSSKPAGRETPRRGSQVQDPPRQHQDSSPSHDRPSVTRQNDNFIDQNGDGINDRVQRPPEVIKKKDSHRDSERPAKRQSDRTPDKDRDRDHQKRSR